MTTVTSLRQASSQDSPRLNEATVVDVGPPLRVRLPNGAEIEAKRALAFPYEPMRGDVLLVISENAAHYVIGVVEGNGRSVFNMPGDTELRAVDGVLRLAGERGIQLDGPHLSVLTRKMQVVAESVIERFGSLHKTVNELFRTRAGEMSTVVEGSVQQKSKRASILTEEKVSINGKEVHLG